MLPEVFMFYLGMVNLSAFCLFGIDKRRAKKRRWRIPERRLFAVALAGGSIGALAGMYGFRHKTRHKLFAVGMPLLFLAQVGVALIVFMKLCVWGIGK